MKMAPWERQETHGLSSIGTWRLIPESKRLLYVQYLGKKLDGGRLYPKTEQNRIQAEIVMAGIVDWVDDGLFNFLIGIKEYICLSLPWVDAGFKNI